MNSSTALTKYLEIISWISHLTYFKQGSENTWLERSTVKWVLTDNGNNNKW